MLYNPYAVRIRKHNLSSDPICCGVRYTSTADFNQLADKLYLIDYFRSFIVATGYHLSNAPRRRLVVTGDSARIQDETTENSAWFFNVLGV